MAIIEKIGGVFDVNTFQTGIQFEPCIAALDNGGFVVGWNNFQGNIAGQLYDDQGFRSGGEFVVNADLTNDQFSPDVAVLSNGDILFTWGHEFRRDDPGTPANDLDLDVRGRRFQEGGTAIDSSDRGLLSSGSRDESNQSVAATNDGRFIVVAQQDNGRLAFNQLDNNYNSLSSGDATPGGVGTEISPSVAVLLDGSYAIAWQGGGNIFERRAVAGDEFQQVNTNSGVAHALPSVAALEDGGYIVAWKEGNAGSNFVQLQRYNFLGDKVGGPFNAVNTPGQIDQTTPIVKGLVGGGWVVAWDDGSFGALSGLRAVAFDSAGIQIGGIIQLTPTGGSGAFGDMDLVQKENGDVVFVWAGTDPDGTSGIDGQIVRIFNEVKGTSGNDRFMTELIGGSSRLNPGFDANDSIQGFAGDDFLNGGGGAEDILDGGSGSDTATYLGSDRRVVANLLTPAFNNGEAIGDRYISIENLEGSFFGDDLTGNNSGNVLDGVDGADSLVGNGGNDTMIGNIGADFMDGGSGLDVLDYTDAGAAIRVDLAAGTASGGQANGDTFRSMEKVAGSAFGDGLKGNSSDNGLAGLAGNDTLSGLNGDDNLSGGTGDDTLLGDAGADTMAGGADDDTYVVDQSGDVVTEAANAGSDKVVSTISYTLGANVENLALSGSGALNGVGNGLANVMKGNGAVNRFEGNGGADQLFGEGGADRLAGNLGSDTLTGGSGADRFVYRTVSESGASSATRDVILDFSRAQGDRIELAAIDANTGISGDQAFRFIGAAAFSGAGGELRAIRSGDTIFVAGDVNGDRVSDFGLALSDLASLSGSDFIL